MSSISYFEDGEGFPIVFLHGFCENRQLWESITPKLASDYRVVCPDLPGFGGSSLLPENFTLEDVASSIIDWLSTMGVERCVVVGHSLGGYVALEALRKYPEIVTGVCLFNSSAFADSTEKKENRNKLIEFIDQNGVKPFLKTFVPSLFYPAREDEFETQIKQLQENGLSINPSSVMGYAGAMRDRQDSMGLLQEYASRVLLIAGEFDLNVPIASSREMASYLPKDQFLVAPESAHMSVFEQEEMCLGFLRKSLPALT